MTFPEEMRRILADQPAWIGALVAASGDSSGGARILLPCADLLDPARFESVFAPCLAPGELRAARLSFWSQHYFGSLCLTVAACALLTGRPVSAPLACCAFAPNPEGMPAAFRVEADLWAGPGRGLLDGLLEDHLSPAVAALSAAGPLAERVLWGNAAHYLEWLVGWMESEGRAAPGAVAQAQDFLERPLLPDGGRNPLAGAIHYAGEAPAPETRRRKTCCLRYRLDCVADCGALCPKTAAQRRRAA
ncbi:siderophore-iron reductase FhuF [Neomegalonema sp.]|uniref:siderophore-iron reductase FhuF n=1 Tax=Neomegalonema sp. TaxID=2039713 RepID=UPI00263613F1|nr:siderophore-iron reductase FhuF [Neomegalonema sp.]MDD2868466.1 siderophore-iron reductase FhuF [Neomegalonema sp.]